MNTINASKISPLTTRSVSYERSRKVEVTKDIRQEAQSEIEISNKTTTEITKEITKTKRPLAEESKAYEESTKSVAKLSEIGTSENSNNYTKSQSQMNNIGKGTILNTTV